MTKLNICIDIDGTVTEAYDWIDVANEFFGKNLRKEDVVLYEIEKVIGVSREEYDDFYRVYGKLIHSKAPIRDGVIPALESIFKNHSIHFVTARSKDMTSVTYNWMSLYQVPYDSISLLGSHHKVKKAKELNCDIFIEDRYENAIELSKEGFTVILIDCLYNQGELPENVIRLENWQQIYYFINQFEKQRSINSSYIFKNKNAFIASA